MQQLSSLIASVIITVGSLFGLAPQDHLSNLNNDVSILNNKISTLESHISSLEQKSTEEPTLGNYSPSGGGTYRLRSTAGSTDTTIYLSSFKEPVSNIPYTMNYLNSTLGYGTIDPQTTKSEFISFTGITQNSDGTANLTGITRGIARSPGTGSCTVASSTLRQVHSGQSIFILSNSPCFYSEYAVKQNNETITGQWSGITPTAASNFATKGYVDGIAVGSLTFASTTVSATAGETVTAGQVLFLKQADTRWYKASVAFPEASTTILGIAQGGGTAGVAISGGVLVAGVDNNQSGLTAGSNYFLSSTAGTLGTGTTTRIVGRAKSATSLYFNTSSLAEGIKNTNNTFTGTNVFNGVTIASSSVTVFNGSGTWTKATQGNTGTLALIEVWGGGGAGGARVSTSVGGGGGGGYNYRFVPVALLGTTETVTVGAGGAGAAGSSIGNRGATTTFGTWVSAYGGGGGGLDSGVDACGGGGGGPLGAGDNGGAGTGGLAGVGAVSGNGACTALTASSTTNGSGGGSGIGNLPSGGNSVFGGAGGGGVASAAGLGGTSRDGGNGGAGNASGNGTAGSQPGGGGGGSFGGTSGAGGDGRVKITIF